MNRETLMNVPQSLLDEIVAEAKADEVGLWFIIGRIRDELGVNTPESLQETTLRCVKEILASGDVVAGYYKLDGTGIDVWDMEPARIVSRIKEAWDQLGREPNIGDIVVLIGNSRPNLD